MTLTVEPARNYNDELRRQFAKTTSQWPHEYTVRPWRPDLDDAFVTFIVFIRATEVVNVDAHPNSRSMIT